MKHFSFPQALHRLPVLAVLFLTLAGIARADAGQASPAAARDKSGYTLFKPTPREALRELSTDRPDQTECPFTVDAGHVQVEMDFATFTQDRTDGIRARTGNVVPFNVRIGLLNNLELSLVFDSYLHLRTEDRAARTVTTQSGVGDFTARMKLNLWGNDGGKTALAVMPFVKFPTNSGQLGNRAVEGGLILPLAIELPGGFGMGLETGVSFMQNDDDRAYHADFVNSISIDHAIVGKLSGYLEFYSSLSTQQDQPWVGTVDAGLKFALTDNVQFDCGCNIGVTDGADDLNPFVGLTIRF
jgi:hypothetical protein